jgi:glycosyltransferase involved in cell wall biosynthesis
LGDLSFVIPVKDEEATLTALHDEIVAVVEPIGRSFEFVFVDDGSRDGSWATVERLAATDSRVRGIRLRRNFGKATALSAGFAAAKGAIVFTLDADLQDDPKEIPRFLETLEAGHDLVSGWKKRRHDPWHKVWPSRVFNRMIGWLTGLRLHDHVCGYKCMRAEVARGVRLYGQMHRFLAVRAFARGFRVTEIVVNHRPREHGRSKYGVSRFVIGFLDLLTVWYSMRFGWRPMHLFGGIGGAGFVMGLVLMVWSAIGGAGYTSVTMGFRFWFGLVIALFGLQFMAFGLLAEHRLAGDLAAGEPYEVAARIGAVGEADDDDA